jgi:hypothetical protein
MQARAQMEARTLDTRSKIQLGGLVVLAGLGEEENAVLLGMLTTMARLLAGPNGSVTRAQFRQTGDLAFKAREAEKLQRTAKLTSS